MARLQTIGVVIGWLGVVLSVITITILSLVLANLDYIVKVIAERSNVQEDTATLHAVILSGAAIYLVLNAINFCTSALLIAGIMKERHLMLIPWLFNAGFALLMSLANFLLNQYMLFASSAPAGTIIFSFVFQGIFLGLFYYVWRVIYKLYRQIQATRDQQQQLLPNAGPAYNAYTKI